MQTTLSLLRWTTIPILALMLTGCGGSDKTTQEDTGPALDNSEEVEAYYQANPEFFVYAKPEDLPADLNWEDGREHPDLGSPDAKKGGTWYQYEPDYPRTLRRIGPDANGSFRLWQTDMRITYARRHPNLDDPTAYIPGVAIEWALDPENATVYVRLDPDARWSDGEPITTEDVFFKFFYNRQLDYHKDPWYKDHYTNQFSKVTRYDDLTFSITTATKKPDYHQYVLLDDPAPKHFFKEFGQDYVERYNWRFQPTTGAYVILDEDIKKGKSIALTRVKDWWAKDKKFFRNLYNPDRIEFTIIRTPEKAFEAFLGGQLDTAGLSLATRWYDQLGDDNPLVQNGYIHKTIFFNQVPTGGFNFWFNTSRPLLDDVNIRKGLAHSCNWDLVIEKVFRRMWSRMHTTGRGYGEADHPSLKSRNFNVEKAGEYFAKAGFTKRGPDGILMNDEGKRLTFTVTTGYKSLQDHLTVLEQEARKAGVKLNIEVLDATASWKKTQEKKHEIAFAGFSFTPEQIYSRYWQTYHGDNAYNEDGSPKTQTNNLVMIDEPILNGLIINHRETESHEEKVRLAHQIEEMLHDLAVHAHGFYRPSYRVGSWRWVKWPEDINVKRSEYFFSWMVHWIDEEVRQETKDAMRKGETYPPQVKVYDQYKSE